MLTRDRLYSACVAGMLTFATVSATAQEAAADADSNDPLQDVVVTARRVTENVQQVPIAISVVSEQTLREKMVTTVYDLQKTVPGLVVNEGNSVAATSATIRGETAPFYFAGVPVSGGGASLFFDVSSAQVLKGPQGTLFGLNSSGGAVLVEPTAPTNRFEGFTEAGVGTQGHDEISAVLNIPIISDTLLLRIGGQQFRTDGYIKDLSNGEKYENEDFKLGRVSLLLNVTDRLKNTIVFNSYMSEQNGDQIRNHILSSINTNTVAPFAPTGGNAYATFGNQTFGGLTLAQQLATQQKLGWYTVRGTPLSEGPYFDYRYYGVVNTTTFDISPNMTLKNIAGFQRNESTAVGNVTLLQFPLRVTNPTGVPNPPDNTYSEEAQFIGKFFNGKVDTIVGTFNRWVSINPPYPAISSITLGRWGASETNTGSANDTPDIQHAVYANATWHLDEFVSGLSLQGGYRYSWEHKSQYQCVGTYSQPTNLTDPGTLTLCPTGPVIRAGDWQKGNYQLGVQYQLNPHTLLYVSYATGSNSGGFNSLALADPSQRQYDPDSLNSLEVGAKTDFTLAGLRGRLNVAAWRGSHEDAQVTATGADANGQFTTRISNGGTAREEGVEGEITLLPVSSLELTASFNYNDNHYTNYEYEYAPGQFEDRSGAPFVYTPEWQYGAGATYHLPVGSSNGDVSAAVTYDFHGQAQTNNTVLSTAAQRAAGLPPLTNLPQDINPSYENVDVTLSWNEIMGKTGLDGRFYVTNLLQEKFTEGMEPSYYSFGYVGLSVARPRMFGVTMRYSF